jgi:uncharacterized membrane protein required for colicin V production
MNSLISNVKAQSIKSLLTSIVVSTIAVVIYHKYINEYILGTGSLSFLPFYTLILGPTLIATVVTTFGLSALIYKKGMVFGILLGCVVFIMYYLPSLLDSSYWVDAAGFTSMVLEGLIYYVLPAAILGYFRKN